MKHECEDEKKLIEEILAVHASSKGKNLSGMGQQQRLNEVGEKYLRNVSTKEQVFLALKGLNDCGFDVREYRHEGARPWGGSETKPYQDEAVKRNLQNKYKPGYSYFVAVKKDKSFLVENFLSIDFSLSDKDAVIANVRVHVSATSI